MLKTLRTVGLAVLASLLMGSVVYANPSTAAAFESQQQSVCTGIVKDTYGETVIGASVIVKGTMNGVITGIDGDFSLTGVNVGDTVQISCIGFVTQEVVWDGKPINIVLETDTQMLEETVVVGYGTQKKVNVTGAVAMVDSEVLASRPVANVQQALQGAIPGLNLSVSNTGGEMGQSMSMNIRGTGNLGTGSSANPLVLIDGIEGNLNAVNPADIENISVLKDASSASIYGARAAFGVILVTTKSGKSGKTNVNYSGNVRFATAIGVPETLNSVEFANYFNRAATNNGEGVKFSEESIQRMQDYLDGKITTTTIAQPDGTWGGWTQGNDSVNWFDEFYGKGVPSHEHNLSVSGGTDKIQYLVSGSILDQTGLLRLSEDKFQRYTLNAKITSVITDWLKLTLNTKWTREDYNRPSYLRAMGGLFFHNVARKWPVHPAYDPNGNPMNESEIYQMQNGGEATTQKDYNTNQLAIVFEPIKDWHINVEGSVRTYTNFDHFDILPNYYWDVEGNPHTAPWAMGDGTYAAGVTRVYEYAHKENYYSTNIYTDYSKQFDSGHYFKVMAGFNAEHYKTRSLSGSKYNLYSVDVPTLNTAASNPSTSGEYQHNSVAGFFGRLNYNYKGRYMLEANIRYDGSSRFVGDKRWGLFPSFSAGWNIAQESFFEGAKSVVNTLKFRGSWGQLGNNSTNSWYPFYETMPIYQNYSWLVGGNNINYSTNPGITSADRTWETVESWDVGLDWALFNNRLTGSFDYFVRTTKDMIGPAPELSNALGATVPQINNTDMKSYGFELEIGWRDQIKDFSYGVRAVLSDAQQMITNYPNESMSISTYYNGRMLGEIWGYTTIGIANSEEEMDAHLAKVDQSSLGNNWGAGDIMYADLDGDGEISRGEQKVGDTGDYTIIGNSTPRYNFGLTLDFAWKGFDFRAFFQGTLKRELSLGGVYFWGANGHGMWQACGFKEHLDYWRPEGDPLGENLDAYYPKVSFGGGRNTYTQTRYIQDASYIRLKNIQLGYTLPQKWTDKAKMQNVRVYVSADNVFTITKMSKMFDPEGTGDYSGWGSGKTYPLQRVISVGLNINF